jgi:glyoxylase-like metal-dependent hydrolase (beta-lactamase superfamily II)
MFGTSVSTRSEHDLLGDGSVILVEMAGHTPGSVGVLLRTEKGPVLIAGDTAWHSLQIEHIRQKAPYPGQLVDSDRAGTFRMLHRLHAIRDRVRFIPTHDPGL